MCIGIQNTAIALVMPHLQQWPQWLGPIGDSGGRDSEVTNQVQPLRLNLLTNSVHVHVCVTDPFS